MFGFVAKHVDAGQNAQASTARRDDEKRLLGNAPGATLGTALIYSHQDIAHCAR